MTGICPCASASPVPRMWVRPCMRGGDAARTACMVYRGHSPSARPSMGPPLPGRRACTCGRRWQAGGAAETQTAGVREQGHQPKCCMHSCAHVGGYGPCLQRSAGPRALRPSTCFQCKLNSPPRPPPKNTNIDVRPLAPPPTGRAPPSPPPSPPTPAVPHVPLRFCQQLVLVNLTTARLSLLVLVHLPLVWAGNLRACACAAAVTWQRVTIERLHPKSGRTLPNQARIRQASRRRRPAAHLVQLLFASPANHPRPPAGLLLLTTPRRSPKILKSVSASPLQLPQRGGAARQLDHLQPAGLSAARPPAAAALKP